MSGKPLKGRVGNWECKTMWKTPLPNIILTEKMSPGPWEKLPNLGPVLNFRGCQRHLIKFLVKSFLFSSPIHRAIVPCINSSNMNSGTTFSFSCYPCEISHDDLALFICYICNIPLINSSLKASMGRTIPLKHRVSDLML